MGNQVAAAVMVVLRRFFFSVLRSSLSITSSSLCRGCAADSSLCW
jgi:hypothetical protein